uniref:hypothetical protein n=1 Tax=Chryseobacterium sp. YIM B08800 TaxID=2984136 RepID=UPI00223EB191
FVGELESNSVGGVGRQGLGSGTLKVQERKLQRNIYENYKSVVLSQKQTKRYYLSLYKINKGVSLSKEKQIRKQRIQT